MPTPQKMVPTKSVLYSSFYGKEIDKENEFNEDEIDAFTKGIKENGILVPIAVRPEDDKYRVLAGNRRLNAAKILRMPEVPVVVEKGLSDTDAALYYFVENTLRRRLTPRQTALAIAQVYETLRNDDGSKMTLQQVRQILNSLFNASTGRTKDDKLGTRSARFTKRPKDFDYVLHRIGYSPIIQSRILSILTDLEPQILDYAEERGLDYNKISKLVENPRLKKEIEGKPEHRVLNYKKRIVDELARTPQKHAGSVVSQAARDLETKAVDLDIGGNYPSLRDKEMQRPLKEGEEGAVLVHLNIQEHAQKLIGALTKGYEMAPGEHKYDFNRERLKKVTKEYLTGMSKFFDDRQIAGILDNLRMLEFVSKLAIEILEDELESREKKKDLVST